MRWYELEFLISRKNVKFISSFVLPHIKLTYKKDKMWVCTYNNIGKITLNRYLSNELRTDEAVEIIENIINEATQSLVNPSYIWKPKIAKHEI